MLHFFNTVEGPMGLFLNEKHYEQADGEFERWYFNLRGWTDPAADYECFIALQKQNPAGRWHIVEDGKYHRTFPRDKFNRRHYANFRRKFARDPQYRKKWEVKDA